MAEDSERSFQELIDAHRRIKGEIVGLYPRVLASFNDYIRRAVNPRIGEGFTLAEATDIWFNPTDDVYEIQAGILIRPEGRTIVESMEAGTRAEALCRQYQEKTPYVRIEFVCTVKS